MKNKKSIGVIAAVGMAVVIAGGAVTLNHQKNNNGEVTSFIPEFEVAQTQSVQEASVAKGIQIPGYSIIPILADSEQVSIDLQNPDANEVYFQISFYLTDTQELIYQSKLIEPGQHLYSITLNRGLAAGEYPLTIQYDTFSMDSSYTPKNGATVNCVLSAS